MESKWSKISQEIEQIATSNATDFEKTEMLKDIKAPHDYVTHLGNCWIDLWCYPQLFGGRLIADKFTDNKPYLFNVDEYNKLIDPFYMFFEKLKYKKLLKNKQPLNMDSYISKLRKNISLIQNKHDQIIRYLMDNKYDAVMVKMFNSDTKEYIDDIAELVPDTFYAYVPKEFVEAINSSIETDLSQSFYFTQTMTSVDRTKFETNLEKGLY